MSSPSHRNLRGRSAAGFTLIELLTVIAIIGILAAIIIPTVSSVKENARSIQCSNRVRQWGMAFTLFANDNKGRYAVKKDGKLWCQVSGAGGDGGMYIPYFARGSVKDYSDLTGCPSPAGQEALQAAQSGGTNTPVYFGYAISQPHKNNVTIPEVAGSIWVPLSSARQPSRTILAIERGYIPGGIAYDTGGNATIQKDGPAIAAAYTNFARHNNKIFTVFMDGHAVGLKWEQMSKGEGRNAAFNTDLLKLD